MYLTLKGNSKKPAAMSGIELTDRHEGNVMVNKMTGRPMQIDPSGVKVKGLDKDLAIARATAQGFREAGLTDEAAIFEGLMNEAWQRQDGKAFHDLTKQGASRLMKINKYVDLDSYTSLFGV